MVFNATFNNISVKSWQFKVREKEQRQYLRTVLYINYLIKTIHLYNQQDQMKTKKKAEKKKI